MIFFAKEFAEIDTALRLGKHLSRRDYGTHEFITRHFDDLERFYAGYGCRLVQHPDGFFFLLARGGMMPTRRLPRSVMHLGMFIALKTRDPELTRSDGRMSVDGLIRDLETSIPADTLSKVYAPKQKEVLTGSRVHEEIMRAMRTLAELGFIDMLGEQIHALEAIQRFAELARHNNTPDQTARIGLAVQRGVAFDVLAEGDGEDSDASQD